MKIIKISIYLIVLILLLNFAGAVEINELNTNIEVYADGIVKVTNELIFDSTKINELVYIPAYNPESIIIKDQDGDLKYATFSGFITIAPRKQIPNYKINLQYLTEALTSKKNNEWDVRYEFPSLTTLNYNSLQKNKIQIIFPQKTTLLNSTYNNKIFTESNSLILEWHPVLKQNDIISVESAYTIPFTESSKIKDYFFILSVAVLIVILIIILFRHISNRYLKKISKGKRSILDIITEPEKQIAELLLRTKNKQLTQAKIHVETGIPKPTLSRAIKKLERRKIIEIKPVGNTNLIVLTAEFCKK